MVIVSNFELEWNTEKNIFRSEYGEEYMPNLHGKLKVIGSRKRKIIDTEGETVRLVLQLSDYR